MQRKKMIKVYSEGNPWFIKKKYVIPHETFKIEAIENEAKEMEVKKGNLPYVVMWIGLHGLPSSEHFVNLESALKQYIWLKHLKRQPTMLRAMEVSVDLK